VPFKKKKRRNGKNSSSIFTCTDTKKKEIKQLTVMHRAVLQGDQKEMCPPTTGEQEIKKEGHEKAKKGVSLLC
jgi:hypothetical protein